MASTTLEAFAAGEHSTSHHPQIPTGLRRSPHAQSRNVTRRRSRIPCQSNGYYGLSHQLHQIHLPPHLQNKNIWRVALTKLPGSLQPQSMITGNYKYAHATSQSGIIGFLLLGCILPSCRDILGVDFTPSGFFCSATLDPTLDGLLKIVVNRSQSAKNSGSYIITGDVIGCHAVVDCGGVYDEQKTVQKALITHRRKDKRWCVHHEHNHPTDLWYVHPDPITSTTTPPAETSSHSHADLPGSTFYVQPTPPHPTILE